MNPDDGWVRTTRDRVEVMAKLGAIRPGDEVRIKFGRGHPERGSTFDEPTVRAAKETVFVVDHVTQVHNDLKHLGIDADEAWIVGHFVEPIGNRGVSGWGMSTDEIVAWRPKNRTTAG